MALEQALRRVGVEPSSPLAELELDAPLALALVQAGPRQRARRWVAHPLARRVRLTVVLAAGVLGATAAVVQLWPLLHPRTPGRMSGDLNVAIAGFGGPGTSAEDGRLLAASVTRSIAGALAVRRADASAPDVQVRQALRSFPAAATAGARGAGAARLAAQLGADVVIYGHVVKRQGHTEVTPEVYVDPARLIGAEELAGPYALATIDAGYLSVTDAVAARAGVRLALSRQLRPLSYFAGALSWFNGGAFGRTRRLLLTATRVSAHERYAGLLQMFLGNADGKLGRMHEAQQAYRAALRAPQVRERARLGLTEIALHRAQAGCGLRTRAAPLFAVARSFERVGAGATRGTLPGAALGLRAELGAGRVDLCLSQAGLADRWRPATRRMRAVIAAGDGERDRFARELAEAHAGLGLALLPSGPRAPHAAVSYRRARTEYRTAAALAVDADRRRTFEKIVRYIDTRSLRDQAPGRAPAPPRVHVVDGAVLTRRDLPPAGVQRQVAYVGGAGPLGCDTPHREHPHLRIYARPNPPDESTAPEIGKVLVVCTDGFANDAPVVVVASGPGGRTLRAVAPRSEGIAYRGVTIDLMPGSPLGRYRVTASQDDRRARASFTLGRATQPGLRVVHHPQRRGDAAVLLGVDLPRDATVLVYRAGAGGPPDYGLHSTYVASFPALPDGDGMSVMRITTDAGTPVGCWWLVVALGKRSVDDQFCVP